MCTGRGCTISQLIAARASAPGKLVLWGEYAVLAGAPAAVMSINRHASVNISAAQQGWRISAEGFPSIASHTTSNMFVNTQTAAMLNCVLQHLGHSHYIEPFTLHTDSSGFYHNAAKLGLGSSAAVCVATYAAVCASLSMPTSMQEAISIHRSFQGGKGSGMDIAASWHGGVIRFQQGAAQPAQWPAELDWLPIWTRRSASTTQHLDQFSHYRRRATQTSLDTLVDCSNKLFSAITPAAFGAYVDALKALDQDAQLGIYTATHGALSNVADSEGLIYKPCGAGGGDFGIAIGDASQLIAFQEKIATLDCQVISLEMAAHGVSVE